MNSVANSWWMYMLGVLVVVFVLTGSLFYIFKSYKDAKAIGMDTKVLKRTIISSAIFTILPSISILVGVIALTGKLGVPFPWIRLSVIGALHYEVLAASTPYGGDFTLATLTAEQFVTIASVMTLGILAGPIFCLFGFKTYDKKLLSKAKESDETEVINENKEETEKPKKKGFGTVLFNAVFIAMISAFIVWDCVKPFVKGEESLIKNDAAYLIDGKHIPIVVVVVTFGCMALFDFLEKKFNQKWLSNFALGLSMIIGMGVAVLLAL
ncbi:MAG: DUF5058 family protein [Clostridia bacterium]|nr:DUF5058 family protein [Clostridia bacterium]